MDATWTIPLGTIVERPGPHAVLEAIMVLTSMRAKAAFFII
jgi:hypothetical protein